MLKKIQPIIHVKEFIRLTNNDDLVIIDANNAPNGYKLYVSKHLIGAQHVDLNSALAKIESDASKGGRHPLPDVNQFAITLGRMGIDQNSHIVVYDNNKSGNAAARFWWMMRSIGHEKIQVLNATIDEAIQEGVKETDQLTLVETKPPYPLTNWQLPMAEISTVEKMANDPNQCVIDVRDAYRYNGESEPIDLIAGHIPGAINIPYSENLDSDGHFLSPLVLRNKYQYLFKDKTANQICIHCGSGVTACHTLLAMDYAGLPLPKLYVGSWSEWSRNGKEIGKNIGIG